MNTFEHGKEYWNSWRTYATQSLMAQGIPSGQPAIDPRANDPQYAPYYEKLAEILDGLSSGFPKPENFKGAMASIPEGADLQYLKTYYLPEHAKLAIHVPAHHFASAEEIAKDAGMEVEECRKMLLEMAERVCIFHKVDNGVDVFRHIGPFPGQVAMSVGRLSVEFWKSIEPYMANYMRPVMFDQDAPSWRYVPLTDAEVAEGDIINDYEVAERILMNADRVAVTSCICRAPVAKACKQCDPPYEVCLQINDYADFYVKDLKVSRYITKEEIKKHIEFCKENHLAILLSATKDAEIVCSCCNDGCCGPTEYFKKYGMGGPNTGKVTHYYVAKDTSKCTNCGKCVEHCFTQHGHLWSGETVQYHPENCVGCGVCVRECPEKALILRLKDEKDRYDWPDSCLDLYDRQGADTYGLKTDYIERGRKK